MSTFKILCVTNRKLCKEDFLLRIKKIAACRPSAIILREKDLSPEEYSQLALSVIKICESHDVPCILHKYFEVAKNLGVKKIHLPLPVLREMTATDKKFFDVIGASCHSLEELNEAQILGCTYVTAGYIFSTDCKKDLEPRGINFLIKLHDEAKVPIFAIGGINAENISQVQATGVDGACIMSGFMKSKSFNFCRCANLKFFPLKSVG